MFKIFLKGIKLQNRESNVYLFLKKPYTTVSKPATIYLKKIKLKL